MSPLFIRGKLSEVNQILSVVSYKQQRSHRHLQPALHPAELATRGKWTYNRHCGHDFSLRLTGKGGTEGIELFSSFLLRILDSFMHSCRRKHESIQVKCVRGVLHPIPKICHSFAFFLYLKEKLYNFYIILTHLCISDPKIRFFFSLDVRCSRKERVNFIFPLQVHGPRT